MSNLAAGSAATATSPVPLDVAAVRKDRMNRELITMFQRPCPPNTVPALQGLGLYTHIEGSDGTPQFLPTKSDTKAQDIADFEREATEEIKSVWSELNEAVRSEERILGSRRLSPEELKRRYEGLDDPGNIPSTRKNDIQTQNAAMPQDISGQVHPSDQTRASLGNYLARSAPAAKSLPTGSRNEYEPSRDPRLQGR
ncbi:hypothetical protein ACN47E_003201 [Coniothyrium glycines]